MDHAINLTPTARPVEGRAYAATPGLAVWRDHDRRVAAHRVVAPSHAEAVLLCRRPVAAVTALAKKASVVHADAFTNVEHEIYNTDVSVTQERRASLFPYDRGAQVTTT